MKKYLLAFMMVLMCAFSFSINAEAQTYKYRTSELAMAKVDTYGKYHWGNWQRCVLDIYIDLDNEKIYIQSNSPQRYRILSCGEWQNDSQGGYTISMRVVDQDGDIGGCRLRIDPNGSSQIYIDWADVAYVYGGLKRLY